MKSKFVILAIVGVCSTNALAIPRPGNLRATPECSESNVTVENQATMIHKIAIFGRDDRKFHQPRKLPSKYGASGLLKCGDFLASAQLIGANDVISTASHNVINKIDCKKRPSCTFTPAGRDPIKVNMDLMIGSCTNDRPDPQNPNPVVDSTRDWAVLKLEHPAEGVTPYRIPERPVDVRGALLNTFVSITQRDSQVVFAVTDGCNLSHQGHYRNVSALNDCDNLSGASGGSHLDEAGHLLGIHVGSRDQLNNGGDFDPDRKFNASVPLSGDFYDAVVAMVRMTTADAGGTRPSN